MERHSTDRNVPALVAGVDFSPASISAVRWAAGWLARDHALILAHALVIPEVHGLLAARYPIPPSLRINARTGAQHRLERLMSTLDFPASFEIGEGAPADVIANIARSNRADLILVGKHGEGGPHRGYTGRTADRLIRSAPAAVLVAHGMMTGAPKTIIVPLTYSSITPHIVRWTRKLQDASGARVVVVHVIGSAVLSHVLSMQSVQSGEPPTADEIDEIFSEDRDRWTRELEEAGVPSHMIAAEVVFGEVSSSVLNSARMHDGDLIVMGSHAGPLRRALLGSAATAVIRESEIPVLVVVEPDPSAPDAVTTAKDDIDALAEFSVGG